MTGADHGRRVHLGLFSRTQPFTSAPMPKLCPTCGNSYDDRNVFCPTDGSTLRTSGDAADLVGSVIADRYLITEKLGQGGMGRVYLAQHVRLPQQAAIKVLHPQLVHDTDALARFNHEASNACRINDAHVARVYDYGETGTGLVYLAMEYVPGETLNELLRTGAPFAPLRAAGLTRQIAAGLDAAHKLGIVHRDLKPDNILVTRDTDGEELVKVVDFGIAKAIDTTTQHVTKTGFVLGTAQYMSPEQVSGRIVDRRSDVYALGLVAFMMLTGKLPFPAETAEEAMVKRLTEAPRTLAEMRDDVPWPEEVQRVFDGALAREIEGRYPTAGAFGKSLSDAIDAWQRPHAAHAPSAAAARPAPAAVRPAASKQTVQPAVTGARPRPGWRFALVGGAVAVAGIAAVLLFTTDNGAASNSAATAPAGGQSTTAGVAGGGAQPIDSPGGAPPGDRGRSGATGDASGRSGSDGPQPTGGRGGSAPTGSDRSGSSRRGGASTPTPPVPDPAAANGAAAVAELERLLPLLDPAVINDTIARLSIPALRRLLPALPTAHDSLRAELARAGAHIRLGEIENGCAVLRALEPRASVQSQGTIRQTMQLFDCSI